MCSRAFLDWCRASGVEHPAVEPALIPVSSSTTSHCRGLVATVPLQPGDVIARIPSRLLLSATGSAARDLVLGPLLLYHQDKLSHHQILILHLLLETAKGPKSPWHPYLRELPLSFAVLAAWPRAAALALQAPHAVRAQQRARASAYRDWQEARPLLRRSLEMSGGCGGDDGDASSSSSSWRRWLWALGAALSRTMHLSPQDRAGCLTPFGDLLNHAAPVGAPWAPDPLEEMAGIERSEDGEEEDRGKSDAKAASIAGDGALDEAAGAYVLRTRRAVAQGGEALLSYGRHTNLELLTLYGFLLFPTPNPDDRAPLPRRHVLAAVDGGDGGNSDSDDDDDDHLAGTYSAPLASQGGVGGDKSSSATTTTAGWYVNAADGRPCWALFEELRRRAALEATTTGCSSSSSSPQLQQALLVEKWLRDACLATLQELPTTAEEDEAWLCSGRGEAPPPEKARGDDDAEDDDPLGIGVECLRLAVEWRLQYKRALLRCVARCDRALAKGAKKEEEEAEAAKTTAPPPPPSFRRGRVVTLAAKKK